MHCRCWHCRWSGRRRRPNRGRYELMGGMARVVQNEVDNLLAADPEQRQAFELLGISHRLGYA
jgi:hypothetical protein